jgi:hypothetical protein
VWSYVVRSFVSRSVSLVSNVEYGCEEGNLKLHLLVWAAESCNEWWSLYDTYGCNIRLAESVVKPNTSQGIFGFMFTDGAYAGILRRSW